MRALAIATQPVPVACQPYDTLADIYDRAWHTHFGGAAEAVARWMAPVCRPGSRLLDVCCGSGHLAEHFVGRGCVVTGVDGSERLLDYAAARLPDATLFFADVTEWLPAGPFDAAICMMDSVNHVTEESGLARLLRLVRQALAPGACFAFDFNLAEAYQNECTDLGSHADSDHVILTSRCWDPRTSLERRAITAFVKNGTWHRVDAEVVQRCYEPARLWTLLHAAGFTDVSFWPANAIGLTGARWRGRCFVRAAATRTAPAETR
jgi:SAM-dependent methyltransferase